MFTFALCCCLALTAQPQSPGASFPDQLGPKHAARLRQAKQLADSVTNRLHITLDFEPILSELIAPEVVEAWRKQLPKNIDSRDVLGAYAAGLSVVYLMPLLQASLKMKGVNLESDGQLPPDVKDSLREFTGAMEEIFSDKLFSTTPEHLQELIKREKVCRLAMLKHIRPDVWTSQEYEDFLKGYPDESRIQSDSDSDVKAMESETGGEVKGPVYMVRREGLVFMIMESAGVMKIAGVAPAWMD